MIQFDSASRDRLDRPQRTELKSATTRGAMLLLVASLLAGCGSHGSGRETTGESGPTPARATAAKPSRKKLVRTIDLPGRVEPYEVAPLHAKVTGYVTRILVDIGDLVQGPANGKPGTLLCELLIPELKEELAQKSAIVAQTEAEVLQADAGVKVAEAMVRSAQAKVAEAQASVAREESRYSRWQSEFQRVASLAESGALTQKVADETRAELDAADAGRKEIAARIASVEALQQQSQASLEKARADAVATRSRLAVAQAEARRLEAMVEYAAIQAPFDGVVVERNVHTGHLVQAGANNPHPLLTVMRTDPVRVIVDVPEIDAGRIDSKTQAELRIPSQSSETHRATVTRTSWSLNPLSRTLTAQIDVENPTSFWRPGQYVQVRLTVAELNDSLSLPKSAIFAQEKQTFCATLGADGKVVRLPIAIGLQAGNDFEIRDGLKGDEQVIVINASSFREGQVVEIAPPTQAP